LTDARSDGRLRDLASALAAGELDQVEAQRVREHLARDPELARLYGEIRAVRRSLADSAAGAATPPPDLRGRILAATLPQFRSLYVRRTHYWPTWLAAAAAAAMLLFFQPPLVRGALESLPRASEGVSSLRAAANRQTDRALAEFGVLRASVSFALEDQMDRWGDRLRDLERATRRRDELLSDPGSDPPAPGPDAPNADSAQGEAAP
jgi:anti-sigma factor RsiW